MCVVSMVYDRGREMWPQVDKWPAHIQRDYWQDWLRMVEAAKEYDKRTKQPDCEDPSKADVLKQILDRLDKLEKKIG